MGGKPPHLTKNYPLIAFLFFVKCGGKLNLMSKKMNKLFVAGAILFLALIATQALAQVGGTSGGPAPAKSEQTINFKDLSPFGSCGKIDCVLAKILKLITYIAIPITSIMVLWGGFQILTAAGDPEKVKTGGKTVLYAAVGFAVILISSSIVSLVTDVINQGGGAPSCGGSTYGSCPSGRSCTGVSPNFTCSTID